MLIFAPSPAFLVFAGILQGFYFIIVPISGAIERELVPADQMGRWIGMNRFCKMVLSACLAFIAGIIWDKFGPQYIFLTFVGIDLFIRLPLLISIQETLHSSIQLKNIRG
jgi:MFS family permease